MTLQRKIAIVGDRGVGKTSYANRVSYVDLPGQVYPPSTGLEIHTIPTKTNYGSLIVELCVVPYDQEIPYCDAIVLVANSRTDLLFWFNKLAGTIFTCVSEEAIERKTEDSPGADFNVSSNEEAPIFYLLSRLEGDEVRELKDGSSYRWGAKSSDIVVEIVMSYILQSRKTTTGRHLTPSIIPGNTLFSFSQGCCDYYSSYLATYQEEADEWMGGIPEGDDPVKEQRFFEIDAKMLFPFYKMFPVLEAIQDSDEFLEHVLQQYLEKDI